MTTLTSVAASALTWRNIIQAPPDIHPPIAHLLDALQDKLPIKLKKGVTNVETMSQIDRKRTVCSWLSDAKGKKMITFNEQVLLATTVLLTVRLHASEV